MATIRDLKVFEALSIMRLDGFKPKRELVTLCHQDGREIGPMPADDASIDLPGSANWLVEQYGMQPDADAPDPEHPGIIWTDYDAPARHPWTFSVLIASDEVDDLTRLAREADYQVCGVEPVAEPTHYGDGGGTVTILKHPDGWCVLPS